MSTRRNRQTGTLVTVYHEPGAAWFTICEDHGQAVEHATGTLARSWAAEPATWCTGCGEILEAREAAHDRRRTNLDALRVNLAAIAEHVTNDEKRPALGAILDTLEALPKAGPVQTVGRVHVSRDLLEPSSTVDNVDPHGIPRPSRVAIARAFLVSVADLMGADIDDEDAAALATLVDGLDTLETQPRREWHPIATRARILDNVDRLETDPEPEPDRLEPCEHGHYLCAVEAGGPCTDEHADDLEPAGDTTRADLEHAAQAATRRALEAPAPILAAFLEDGTYSVGQLAAVIDVRAWSAADLDRLEACPDRDRLALAIEIDRMHA